LYTFRFDVVSQDQVYISICSKPWNYKITGGSF
jgi:hypothetical protein